MLYSHSQINIMEQINWGIIGCGNVTEIKSGPAFNLVPHSNLTAVMRRDAEKAADYSKRHHVKRWYHDAHNMINDQEVNAIYIATPPAFHEEYALASFQAGKPVYVEKPMALNAAGCLRMLKAAEASSCKLSIAHYRRAQPKFTELRRIIREGLIGDILSAEIIHREAYQPGVENTWRVDPEISGGGLFHDLAPHQLDLMVYFFGKPQKVSGNSSNTGGNYNADDLVRGEIIFKNGIKFKGEWNFNASPEDATEICEITGSRGTLRFSIFGNSCELESGGRISEMIFDHLPHVQQPMIEQVVNYFLDKGPNPCSAADALEVMKVMDTLTGNQYQVNGNP